MNNTNAELIAATQDLLLQLGVREIIVSAGSRNALLVFALADNKNFRLLSHFEERSAGFFALARAQESSRPVAVLCTSGTAVANLLPSVIEGHYAQVPLIVISADRPKKYRQTGAPQSIEQKDIFGPYVEACLDWDSAPTDFQLKYSGQRPLHLNLCFSEPLNPLTTIPKTNSTLLYEAETSFEWSQNEMSNIQKQINSFKRPLVIVSKIPLEDRNFVCEFLLRLKAPVFLEASSTGVHTCVAIGVVVISQSDKIFHNNLFSAVGPEN